MAAESLRRLLSTNLAREHHPLLGGASSANFRTTNKRSLTDNVHDAAICISAIGTGLGIYGIYLSWGNPTGVSAIQTFCTSMYWVIETIMWMLWCAACIPPAAYVNWSFGMSDENVGTVLVLSFALKHVLVMVHVTFSRFRPLYSMAYGCFATMMGLDLGGALLTSFWVGRWWRRTDQ